MKAQLEVWTPSLNSNALFAEAEKRFCPNSHNFFKWDLLVQESEGKDEKDMELRLTESLSVC